MNSKAAISFPSDLHCKAIAALFFIPYCHPFEDIAKKYLITFSLMLLTIFYIPQIVMIQSW